LNGIRENGTRNGDGARGRGTGRLFRPQRQSFAFGFGLLAHHIRVHCSVFLYISGKTQHKRAAGAPQMAIPQLWMKLPSR
jgi:hypothetical protein